MASDSSRSTTSPRGCASADYLADAGIAGVVFLADRLEKPVLVEGPAGVGKTELAKAHRRGHRRPPDPAPVLRGPRRGQGAVRVELQEAAAAHPGRPGARDRAGRTSSPTSSPSRSCSPARCSRRSAPRSRSCSSSTRSTGSRSRPRRCCSRCSPTSRCRSPSSARSWATSSARSCCSRRTTPASCRRR